MGSITLSEIGTTIGLLTVIGGFFVSIFKLYKTNIIDKFKTMDNEIKSLEAQNAIQEKEIKDSKEERLVMLNGLLACLKGLHNDLNCNGPVTKGINDIEEYLKYKTHE